MVCAPDFARWWSLDTTHHHRSTPAWASERGLVPGTRSGRRVVNPELVPRAGPAVTRRGDTDPMMVRVYWLIRVAGFAVIAILALVSPPRSAW